MEQEITELRNPDRDEWSHAVNKKPRPLTHDERKAAEAAFQQLPFNPEWSDAARRIYYGITDAMTRLNPHSLVLHEAVQGAAMCKEAA